MINIMRKFDKLRTWKFTGQHTEGVRACKVITPDSMLYCLYDYIDKESVCMGITSVIDFQRHIVKVKCKSIS